MGSISSRAGTVAVRAGPLAIRLSGITDARPNLPPQQPADHRIQIRGEIRMACVRGRGVCAHHKKATARKGLKVTARQLTQAPPDPVPGDRRANRPAHDEAYPGWFLLVPGIFPDQQMTHHPWPARTGPGAHGQRELRAAAHPGLGRQDQALSRSRPLRLRAARMARPARVRMRSRKPCVLARRRLFGWNVRLLTGAPGRDLDCHFKARVSTACGSRIQHRLPPRTPLFAGRALPVRLRLWKATLPKAAPVTACSGEATCTTCG